jgi:hypothetical protein
MGKKSIIFFCVSWILSVISFVLSCSIGGKVGVVFLSLAILLAIFIVPLLRYLKLSNKMLYVAYLTLLLSNFMIGVKFVIISQIFGFVSAIAAMYVIINLVVTLNKYSRSDIDKHLDEL